MVSSEKADPGSGRSHFSQTCTLLSQYLKEKGSFGDLNHSLTPKAGTENGQMTIFYSGKVVVLDDIPANKATEIMTLATTYSVPPQKPSVAHDLPIARKNSLARFLEKRKDRITGIAPYQASKSKSALKAEPWLELGSQLISVSDPSDC